MSMPNTTKAIMNVATMTMTALFNSSCLVGQETLLTSSS